MVDDPRAGIVNALADAWLDAWNRHDAVALSATFAPDAELVNFRGRRLSGNEAIRNFLARAFGQNLKTSAIAPGERRVRFVGDTVAALDLAGTISGVVAPKGGPRPARAFRLDGVVVANPRGGWWLVTAHLSDAPLRPDAGPGAAPAAAPEGDDDATG